MGLSGWADAVNSSGDEKLRCQSSGTIENQTANEIGGISPVSNTSQVPVISESQTSSNNRPFTRTETPVDIESELFDSIANLRLYDGPEESHCDISQFELHEVKFLFSHAERSGFCNYFDAVRAVFAVKHRLMDEKNDIDSISSPNLDELIEFVEDKYGDSFNCDTK